METGLYYVDYSRYMGTDQEEGTSKRRGRQRQNTRPPAAKKTGKQQTWDEEEEFVRKAVRLSAFLLIPNRAQHPSGWPSGQIRSDAFQLTRESKGNSL